MHQSKPALAWGHININVSDLDHSIGFYQKLGFDLFIPGIPYLELSVHAPHQQVHDASADALGINRTSAGRACIMQLGKGLPKLDLTEWKDRNQQTPPSNADLGIVRLCLASQDLQHDYEVLKQQRVPFISEPKTASDGMAKIAICSDPDGSLIELIQIHMDRWPS